MIQHGLKLGLIAVVLSFGAQNASAFGRCCWGGCGWGPACCWGGGYAYGGWGYGGYYAAYPAWGYGGWGYAGWGPVGYSVAYPVGFIVSANTGNSNTNNVATVAASRSRTTVSSSRPDSTSVLLTVNVPADAKVFINGHETTSTGERRQYKSSNLLATDVYNYQVRAEFVRDGKPVVEEQTVQLTPGQIGSFAFTADPASPVADMAAAPRR